MSAPALAPMLTAADALASAYALPLAIKDTALRHARAFIADCQHPADREAGELLVEIDRALGVGS